MASRRASPRGRASPGLWRSGPWSAIIAGIDFVTADHQAGEPAVANMSLGGGANLAVDQAVKNSIADGVAYAVAAGNSNAPPASSARRGCPRP